MNIQTDKQIVVFRNENQYGVNYLIGLSRKDKDGEYINAYIPVRFKNDIDLKDKTKIYITNAFLTFYLKQDKKPVFYIMIMEYETIEETIEKSKETSPNKQNSISPYEEFAAENDLSDLPF